MKSYDEVTKSLLERRDYYLVEQKQKRKRRITIAIASCSLCLGVSLGLWQGGVLRNHPLDQSVDDALYVGIKDTFDESKSESVDNPAVNNKIVVNQMETTLDGKMNICLLRDDFVEMTRDEMTTYYGVDYIPEVPADMKQWENDSSGIYRQGGGTGDIYWDADDVVFSNEDATRGIRLTVAKGKYPFFDFWYYDSYEEVSIINNFEVLIGQPEDGIYYAKFMYKDVGFVIITEGITLDELVAVITTVLK